MKRGNIVYLSIGLLPLLISCLMLSIAGEDKTLELTYLTLSIFNSVLMIAALTIEERWDNGKGRK